MYFFMMQSTGVQSTTAVRYRQSSSSLVGLFGGYFFNGDVAHQILFKLQSDLLFLFSFFFILLFWIVSLFLGEPSSLLYNPEPCGTSKYTALHCTAVRCFLTPTIRCLLLCTGREQRRQKHRRPAPQTDLRSSRLRW